ncbi:hypothetical protein K502DRAFT_345950 [Neoconidiobolus thromboides FSU 785]|nr:hypothetical protein K502DRAFT_345950 [Neoconidiobolus thromboides FSU 785]
MQNDSDKLGKVNKLFANLSLDDYDDDNSTSSCSEDIDIETMSSGLNSDSSRKLDPEACLFVASLVSSKTENELHKSVTAHFSHWGELLNVKVLKDNMNRPYSFVQFKDLDASKRALKESPNTIIDGRQIRVEKARVNRTLFISNIGSIKEKFLKEGLSSHGPIESLKMIRSKTIDAYNGSCFVKYRFREDAIAAYTNIKNDGDWAVEWASSPDKAPRNLDFNSIFVGQIDKNFTHPEVEDKFIQYGEIESLNYINRPKYDYAFAFIRYVDRESCVNAINICDGEKWNGSTLKVQFKVNTNLYDNYNIPKHKFFGKKLAYSEMTDVPYVYPQYYNPVPIFTPEADTKESKKNGVSNSRDQKSKIHTNGFWVPYTVLTRDSDGKIRQNRNYYFSYGGQPPNNTPSPTSVYFPPPNLSTRPFKGDFKKKGE